MVVLPLIIVAACALTANTGDNIETNMAIATKNTIVFLDNTFVPLILKSLSAALQGIWDDPMVSLPQQ